MRTYLKSLGSFSWAMSLFGLKNLGAFLTFSGLRRRGARADGFSEGLEEATRALTDRFGAALKALFHSGDRFVRGLVDLSFGRPRPRASADDAMPWMKAPFNGRQASGTASAAAPGFPFDPVMAGASATPFSTPEAGPAPSASSASDPAPAPMQSGWGPMPPIPDTRPPSAGPGDGTS